MPAQAAFNLHFCAGRKNGILYQAELRLIIFFEAGVTADDKKPRNCAVSEKADG